MTKKDENLSLIDGYLKNNCSKEEFHKVVEILKDPNQQQKLQSVLFQKWNEPESEMGELSEDEKKDLLHSLSIVHHKINLEEGRWDFKSGISKISGVLQKIAAVLFLPVIFVSYWYFITSRNPYQVTDSFITIDTPNGSKIRTELPDGTVVWQNSGSTVKYPRNFTKRNRQVILKGEAFFDVKSDKLHPFYVTTQDLQIMVTGTRFDVSAYEDEKATSVILESGKITAHRLNSQLPGEYSLIPGDRLISSGKEGEMVTHQLDVAKYTSWIKGKLIFREDPLCEIFTRLSRWYNVEIVLKDPEGRFRNLPFTMTIENESLPQIMEYLRHAAPLIIKEKKITLQPDGNFSKPKYIIMNK